MKFLEIDSPLIKFLSRMADLMWLNILTVVCCLPIITVGASLTSLNYMALKIARNEEGYITKGFFKAFKENFKQSTIIWGLFLIVLAVLYADYYIIVTMETPVNRIVKILILVISVLVAFTLVFVFPLQAKFANSVKRTIMNAFAMSILQLPKTVLMILLYLAPYVFLYVFNGVFPIFFVFFLSIPALLCAKLYNKYFLSLEQQILEQTAAKEEGAAEELGQNH